MVHRLDLDSRLTAADLAEKYCTSAEFIAACVLLALGFYYAAARRAFYDRVRSIKAQRVDAEVERLRKQDHLNLPNLFALNRRQLDEYHTVSVRQQAVAFRNAQLASAIGFIVLLTGVIITMNQAEDAERWVTAGLAGLGATR